MKIIFGYTVRFVRTVLVLLGILILLNQTYTIERIFITYNYKTIYPDK